MGPEQSVKHKVIFWTHLGDAENINEKKLDLQLQLLNELVLPGYKGQALKGKNENFQSRKNRIQCKGPVEGREVK